MVFNFLFKLLDERTIIRQPTSFKYLVDILIEQGAISNVGAPDMQYIIKGWSGTVDGEVSE